MLVCTLLSRILIGTGGPTPCKEVYLQKDPTCGNIHLDGKEVIWELLEHFSQWQYCHCLYIYRGQTARRKAILPIACVIGMKSWSWDR